MSEEEELWQNRIVSWNGSLCPSPCGAAFWGRHEGSVALLLGLWEGWLGCSSAASCRWMFLLEMGFAGLPSSFPYPEAVASGWLGGPAGSMAEALFWAQLLGLPILLSPLFPSLTSWAFGLISSHTQTSGSQQDPCSQPLSGF